MTYNKPAIIVHTCDKKPYSDIWDTFTSAFVRHFPIDLNWPTYFVNEELDYHMYSAKQIKTGKGEWSDRLKIALNQIPEEHILYFQEDFIIEYVSKELLQQAYEIHHRENDITKLANNYEFTTIRIHNKFINDGLQKLPLWHQDTGLYLMSHQPVAFFNKKFLLSTLDKSYGPSEHEMDISKQINYQKSKIIPYIICIGNVYYPVNKSDIITIRHAIRKGQFI